MNATVTITLTLPFDQLNTVLAALAGVNAPKPTMTAVTEPQPEKPAKTEKKAAKAEKPAETVEPAKAEPAKVEPAKVEATKVEATPIPDMNSLKQAAIDHVGRRGEASLVEILGSFKAKKLSEVPEAKRVDMLKALLA